MVVKVTYSFQLILFENKCGPLDIKQQIEHK